jgi:hypothetical protein
MYKLFYKQPATLTKLKKFGGLHWITKDENLWQQTVLPVGNGDLGGTIYGETDVERIVINEKTLWSGHNLTKNQQGKNLSEHYFEMRKLIAEGKPKEAEKLLEKLADGPEKFGSYLCFGEVNLNFNHDFKKTTNYTRGLDIDNSVAYVSYVYNGVKFKREYLASNPHKVLAIHLTADKANALNFDLSFNCKQNDATVNCQLTTVNLNGCLENGLFYYGRLWVTTCDGTVAVNDNCLQISGATCATVYVAAATDYKQEYPHYRTGETGAQVKARVDSLIENALFKGYESIKNEHIADYKALYDRVKISLGGKECEKPTDALLNKYNSSKPQHKRYLEELLFNYGRYLLISCSRKDSLLPANLQGVWNASNKPPWNADYHTNINLQMNYWLAYPTNLCECADPLVEFTKGLVEPAKVTASSYTGVEDSGFVTSMEMSPYGFTGMRKGSPWAWSTAASAWTVFTFYEGYRFKPCLKYLKTIYPIIKEAVKYFDVTLMDDGSGKLVSAPAYSPEHGPLTLGNTYEQTLVWQLYKIAIEAAEALGEDENEIKRLKGTFLKLRTIEIGTNGQIKEWYNETKLGSLGGERRHRHISHLLGLYPCDLINSPEELKAARVSLNIRGDKSTGWAMGQRINTWARLSDGNRCLKLIKQLFKTGIYPNLWDAHPPFQIDGNFGYTSGVAEMLVQSHLGYIELLPALPDAWQNGRASGILARGGYQIEMIWKDKALTELKIYAANSGAVKVKMNGEMKEFAVLPFE